MNEEGKELATACNPGINEGLKSLSFSFSDIFSPVTCVSVNIYTHLTRPA